MSEAMACSGGKILAYHDFPISHEKIYISMWNTRPLLQIGDHINIWLLFLNKVFSDIMSIYFYSRLDGAVSKWPWAGQPHDKNSVRQN
jgi:hypothetical protein